MRIIKNKLGKRRQDRIRGVLPVRLRGKDSSGALFEALAHTLDLTPTGVRLGAVRQELKALDTVIVLFRKRRIEFTVMWSRMLDRNEYQVGLQMVAMESDPWGLSPTQAHTPLLGASAVSGAA
jgi:hypothetical protein